MWDLLKYILCAFCILLQLLCCVTAERRQARQDHNHMENDENERNSTFTRYVVENDYKPPIFGSYKYNPVLHQFEFPNGVNNSTTKATNVPIKAYDSSTAIAPPGSRILRSDKLDRFGGSRSNKLQPSSNKKTKESPAVAAAESTRTVVI